MGCMDKSKVTTTSQVDPIIKKNVLAPMTSQMYSDLFTPGGAFQGGPVDWVYEGQRYAGPTALQNQAFQWAGGLPQNTQAMQGFGLNLLNRAPNFEATRAYTSELWNRDIVPAIMERFGGMGAADSGGARQAMMRAGEQAALGLASQLAPMELQAGLGSAALLPAMSGMGTDAMKQLGLMGAEQRGLTQGQMQSEMGKFYESLPWSHPALQAIFPTMQMTPGAAAYNSQAGMGYSLLSQLAGPMMQGAGQAMGGMMGKGVEGIGALAGGLASLIGGMFSDRRLKENVRPVAGALAKVKSLRAYHYNFKGDETPHIGLMAQEVEDVLPEAVHEIDGIKRVDVYAVVSLLVQAVAELLEVKGAE